MHDKIQLGVLIILICIGLISTSVFAMRSDTIDNTGDELAEGIDGVHSTIEPISEGVSSAKLYNLINGYRKEKDLPKLTINPALEKSAQLKLQDMISEKYWRHEDSQNVQSWYLFTQAGYDYTVAGENLAFGLNTAWQVFDGWIQSPRHNQELITETYQDMGIAIDCQTYIQENKPSCVTVLHLGAN